MLYTLYSLRRPQPQNVTLDLDYSLSGDNYKHFQGKNCKSLKVGINKTEFVKLIHSNTVPFKFSRINHRLLVLMDGCNTCCGISTVPLR